MMLLRARDNNIQSFAYTWLHKGNENEFLKHLKIKSKFKLKSKLKQSRGWRLQLCCTSHRFIAVNENFKYLNICLQYASGS